MPQRVMSKTMRIDLLPRFDAAAGGAGRPVVVTAAEGVSAQAAAAAPEPLELAAYHSLLHSIYDGVVIADEFGRVTEINERAEALFRATRGDLCAASVFDLISGADPALLASLDEQTGSHRHALIQAYCLRRDQTVFPAEIAVSRLALGDLPLLCFLVRDVTVRRQTEEMLWTEHNAIQNSGSAIAVVNLEGFLEYANPAMARMWGFEGHDALLGTDFRVLLGDALAADAIMNAVLTAGKTWMGEMDARRQNGERFHVQVSATCNRLSDEFVAGFVVSFLDISDRIRADESMREAERHRVMLESLGAACHHMGQPATVLMANMEMLREELLRAGLDGKLTALATGSLAASRRLAEVLHKLNSVHEYRTTVYTARISDKSLPESRILDI